MQGDCEHCGAMRLLPFTAAADEAAWFAGPATMVGSASESACGPGPVQEPSWPGMYPAYVLTCG